MSSIRLSLKRKETASFDLNNLPVAEEKKAKKAKKEAKKKPVATSQRNLQFDLFAHLSYMASVSTAGVTRAELFEFASELPYASSRYFRDIHMLARKLNIDYAEACTMVSERTKNGEMSSLLLRMAGSLASGEDETEFFQREAQVIGEVRPQEEGLKLSTDNGLEEMPSFARDELARYLDEAPGT